MRVEDLERVGLRQDHEVVPAHRCLFGRARRDDAEKLARRRVEADAAVRAQHRDLLAVGGYGIHRAGSGHDRPQPGPDPLKPRRGHVVALVGRPAVDSQEPAVAHEAADPRACQPAGVRAAADRDAADLAGPNRAREPALLRPRERRRVEVVVALGVATLVHDPGHPRGSDRQLPNARAGARVVGMTGLLAADGQGGSRQHVPDVHPVAGPADVARDVVGDPRPVHRERFDLAGRALVGTRASADSRARRENHEHDSEEPEEHRAPLHFCHLRTQCSRARVPSESVPMLTPHVGIYWRVSLTSGERAATDSMAPCGDAGRAPRRGRGRLRLEQELLLVDERELVRARPAQPDQDGPVDGRHRQPGLQSLVRRRHAEGLDLEVQRPQPRRRATRAPSPTRSPSSSGSRRTRSSGSWSRSSSSSSPARRTTTST